MKFRKKPVIVEAVQLTRENLDAGLLPPEVQVRVWGGISTAFRLVIPSTPRSTRLRA